MDDYGRILEKLNEMNHDWMSELTKIAVKTSKVETKLDTLLEVDKELEKVREIAYDAKSSAKDSHERLNKLDKWTFLIGSTVVVAITGSIIGLVLR